MSWTTALLAQAVWGTVALAPYFFAARTVAVDVVDTAPNFFQPDVMRVRAGDTVVFSLGHDHAKGIIKGVAKHDGERIVLAETTCMLRNDSSCRLSVKTAA